MLIVLNGKSLTLADGAPPMTYEHVVGLACYPNPPRGDLIYAVTFAHGVASGQLFPETVVMHALQTGAAQLANAVQLAPGMHFTVAIVTPPQTR